MTRALLLERNPSRLAELSTGLRNSGLEVRTAGRIADVERWPVGEIVVTDLEFFTPWWNEVGAAAVVVFTHTEQQGIEVCRRGATAWILRNCSAGALLRMVESLNRGARRLAASC